MLALITIAAAIILVLLGRSLFARYRTDRIAVFNDRRRATAQLVGRGEFVDGNRHFDVALAVTPSTLFYESPDMEASLDLDRVHEVEYDNELLTGARIVDGKVLRLRSHSQTFEFVIPQDSLSRWRAAVPPRQSAASAQAAQTARA